MDAEFNPYVEQVNERQGAQVIQIDSSKHVQAITVCAVICGASVVLATWAAFTARDAATQYQILLNHTMQLEAALNAQKEKPE